MLYGNSLYLGFEDDTWVIAKEKEVAATADMEHRQAWILVPDACQSLAKGLLRVVSDEFATTRINAKCVLNSHIS